MNIKYFLSFFATLLLVFALTELGMAADLKGAVLFDAGHAEDAGNADWLIQGAYSDFADILKAHGFTVNDTREPLTLDKLQKFQALVLPEPNTAFTPVEEKAIVDFINNGGGVFFIGDHIESDRNRDGIDSVGIFNRFVSQLGFRLEDANVLEANLSAEPVDGAYKEHPVTYKIKALAIWAGTSIRILEPAHVSGLIFFNDYNYGQPAIASGTFGQGRFVILGDSAVFDDGSGTNPIENLHKGIQEFDHRQLALNILNWLTNHPTQDL